MTTYRTVLLWMVCSLWATAAFGLDMTPRAYWPSPKGTRVAVIGYSYSSGNVYMDPSIPMDNVETSVNAGFLAYLQTFSLWGRTTNVLVELPYLWGTTKGFLFGNPARRDFSNFGDLGITLSVNLLGAPSMTLDEFQALRADPHPILGTSLKVVAPTGRYEKGRLINVGQNRWAVKPELAYIFPLSPKWLLEFEAGVWFFSDDDDFLPGKREQDPIFQGEVHLVRRFRPGFWASLEYTHFEGGQQTIGGNELSDRQKNSRMGATVVVPVCGRHAIKLGYSFGTRTAFSSDLNQFAVSYAVVF